MPIFFFEDSGLCFVERLYVIIALVGNSGIFTDFTLRWEMDDVQGLLVKVDGSSSYPERCFCVCHFSNGFSRWDLPAGDEETSAVIHNCYYSDASYNATMAAILEKRQGIGSNKRPLPSTIVRLQSRRLLRPSHMFNGSDFLNFFGPSILLEIVGNASRR